VNPFLAIGQIIVSIALMASILLQSRGTGLSGTFGGDSAVYRSRRGIERRLFQFTVALAILFVALSLLAYTFAPTPTSAG
jgi:preprotein translocase subunit SecG